MAASIAISQAELDAIDDRADAAAVVEFRRKLAAGEEELIPSEIVGRLIDGENKTRVWREHRGLTARDLAVKAAMSPAHLSRIEAGTVEPTSDELKLIAEALGVSFDDLA
ncbi:MAG: helix-turn-helix transcriptional regulator [Candidatus Kaistia colombiensis]|nr:MAG: helix-turn-helix transcriptional regulator [Kaistia sp.]